MFKQALRDGRLADPTPSNKKRLSLFRKVTGGGKSVTPNRNAEERFSKILGQAILQMKDSILGMNEKMRKNEERPSVNVSNSFKDKFSYDFRDKI